MFHFSLQQFSIQQGFDVIFISIFTVPVFNTVFVVIFVSLFTVTVFNTGFCCGFAFVITNVSLFAIKAFNTTGFGCIIRFTFRYNSFSFPVIWSTASTLPIMPSTVVDPGAI